MAKIASAQKRSTTNGSAHSSLTEKERHEVEQLAYQLFIERGNQHGFDQEDWLRAETIVRKRRSA